MKTCKDCEPGSKRPAPHPGPRCATHHREVKRARTKAGHDKRVCDQYGLLPGDYDAIIDFQEGKCAICQRATGATRRLAVDHDHKIEHLGRDSVRGVLCRPCNRMLGHGRDDPEFFYRAAQYLKKPPALYVFDLLAGMYS